MIRRWQGLISMVSIALAMAAAAARSPISAISAPVFAVMALNAACTRSCQPGVPS